MLPPIDLSNIVKNFSYNEKKVFKIWYNDVGVIGNGIMLPNKRTVNGEEQVIHSNHHGYEDKLRGLLNSRWSELEEGVGTSQAALDLFEEIKLFAKKNNTTDISLEKLLVKQSLMDNINVNKLNITGLSLKLD